MKKNIDIKDDLLDDMAKLAIDEKRRGKTDVKNFIEDVVEAYVLDKKSAAENAKPNRISYKGICINSPKGNTNVGHIWTQDSSGMFRSETSGIVLTEDQMISDERNGFVKRL